MPATGVRAVARFSLPPDGTPFARVPAGCLFQGAIMTGEDRREVLLGLLEQIHRSANELQDEVTALHQNIRFDHQSPGAREAAHRIEGEVGQLAERLRELRLAFEEEQKG